ncbi:hypothetical protein [Selenomonas noxia]|jgi:hypothetical protein|uniref:hypothetical protein n=1 Tax=Selenomonas noxia TaxID=135083 RepID=UPI0028804537|nr:hypothetical protein [Selenomonas noxia]
MTKTVYAYAADGKYIGERTLDDTDRSPISGAWQIPGNMTETKPPKGKEGYDIYWRSGKWIQIERPKPEPTPAQPENNGMQEQDTRQVPETELAVMEGLVDLQTRLAALEAKLKGGE